MLKNNQHARFYLWQESLTLPYLYVLRARSDPSTSSGVNTRLPAEALAKAG
jgi:hypothetical protein